MANEVDDIVQNIVLTGDQEAIGAFDSIREAGERAFEAITKAVEHSTLSFTGMATAVGGVAASIAIISVGMFEFVKSTEEGISALSDLADQADTTTEEMSGIKAAFAAGGVAGGQLETAFRRLSVAIQQSWTEIRQASRQSADQLKGDALAVSNAELALSDATRKRADIERNQAVQSRQNIAGVAGAQQTLNELNARRLASLGADTTALDEQLARNRDILAIKQAQFALEQAKTKLADDAANADKEALKIANAEEQAQLSLNQARRKAEDDKKNDINNVTKAVKSLVSGNKDALDDINASAENLSKGIINSVADSTKALGGLKGDISDLASPAPGVKETFLQLGKVLQSIEDPALKTALATRLLSRTITQDFLKVLSNPEAIETFIKRVDGLGLAVNDADKEVGEKFRSTLFQLQNDIQLVGNKVATAFGPGFTTILKAIDDALINNRNSIIEFGESVATKAVPVVESLIRVLTGAAEPRDQWLVDYTEKLKSFGTGIGTVVGIVVKAFSLISDAASATAKTLNDVFGTNLNAVDVAFGVWAAAILSRFAIVQAAAKLTAGVILIAFSEAFLPVTIGIGLLYALKKAYDAVKEFFGVGTADKSEEMWKGAEDRLKAIGQMLSGDIKGGIDAWIKAGEEQTKKEEEKNEAYKKFSEEREKTTEKVLTHEKKTNDEAVTSHKNARQKINDDSKSSADKRIADLERLTRSEKQAAAEQKQTSDAARQSALTQNQPNVDGGFTDANGVRNFGSSGGGGTQQSLLAAKIQELLKQTNDRELSESTFGAGLGTKTPIFATSPGGAEVSQPLIIEKPPLPTSRPIEADGLSEAIVEGLKEAAAQDRFLPESLTPAFPKPGEFPPPPQQEPLSPDLQAQQLAQTQGRTLADVFEPLRGIADFLRNAVTDPGKLQPNNDANRADSLTPAFQALEAETEKQTGTLDNILNGLQNFLDAKKGGEVPANETGNLGIRGDAGEQIDSAFQTAATSIESGAQAVVSALENAAQRIAAAASNAQSSSGGTVTAAGGGYIQGPGTPTSDSIFARLSTNEFVHNAQAVKHYGVDFMHAINRMQLPRFALGGLVGLFSPQLPRFASGGLVSASNSGGIEHIGTVDLTTNHGTVRVAVDRGGLSQLRKASVMRNIGKEKQSSWVK